MKLVEQKTISKAGVEPDAPQGGKLDGKPPLDGAGRALAWAVLGVFVAECLTGLVLLLYPSFLSAAGMSYEDMLTLPPVIAFGMVMRHLHGLCTLSLLFVAPFAVVRAVLHKRQPGGRAARTAALVALVALVLALLVPGSFRPWEAAVMPVVHWILADQAAPRPIGPPFSARELLSGPGQALRDTLRWRLYLNHVMTPPLALICLLAAGAHKLRKRR